MGRTSLAVLHSMRWEMLRRRSPGVSMPWVGVLHLPSRVPPKAGTACAYHFWFVSATKLNFLPGKPGGKPYAHGTIRVPWFFK
jgi:hypothetical protein